MPSDNKRRAVSSLLNSKYSSKLLPDVYKRQHFSPFPLVADITEDKVTNRTARLTVVFLIENNTDVYQPGLFAVFHPDILKRHILHPVLVARTHGHHSTVIVVILIHVQHVYVAEQMCIRDR